MLRDDLHFSPAAWNPGHCLTSSAKSARDPVTSRALLPRGFLRGRRACPERAKRVEGCRQADEGALHAAVSCACAGCQLTGVRQAWLDHPSPLKAPLIRLRHLLPPQKTAGG